MTPMRPEEDIKEQAWLAHQNKHLRMHMRTLDRTYNEGHEFTKEHYKMILDDIKMLSETDDASDTSLKSCRRMAKYNFYIDYINTTIPPVETPQDTKA